MTPYAFPPDVLLFRVEPESRSQYFRVYIWPTLKAMRAYIKTFGETTLVDRGHAFTLDWTIHHRGQVPRGLLGEMHFARRWTHDDLIAHEVTHAALIWARQRKFPSIVFFGLNGLDLPAEERLCYAVGSMCQQITATLEKYGFS
jgi:hypothetical protein